MVLRHFDFHRRFRAKIHGVLSWLQNRNPKTTRALLQRHPALNGLCFLAAAALLAWVSFVATREMSIVEFQSTHSIAPLAWKSIIEHHHRVLIQDPTRIGVITSGLTSSSPDHEKGIQISENGCWVRFPQGTLAETASLWECRDPPRGIPKWTVLPFSLAGFETLLSVLETHSRQLPKPRVKKGNSIDPKEIHY
jgi:hypothetical protein